MDNLPTGVAKIEKVDIAKEKKIVVKYMPKGKDKRTYVYNIETYVSPDKIKYVIKKIKEDFGTSCVYKENDYATENHYGKGYGFGGSIEEKIIEKLMKYCDLKSNVFES